MLLGGGSSEERVQAGGDVQAAQSGEHLLADSPTSKKRTTRDSEAGDCLSRFCPSLCTNPNRLCKCSSPRLLLKVLVLDRVPSEYVANCKG